LPGNTNNISSWIKGYLSAALSFTGVFIVLNIAYYIMLMGAIGGAPIDNLSETPPLIATTGTEAYKIIVFGIVLLLPAIPAAIDDALQTAPSSAVSRAAGDASQALKKIPIVGGFLG